MGAVAIAQLPVESGKPGLVLEVEQQREVLMRMGPPRPQQSLEGEAHRPLLELRVRLGPVGLCPDSEVRVDAALDVLNDAKGEPIGCDQADPAPVGGQKDGVDAGVEPDLVDARAGQWSPIAQAAEPRDPGAVRQQTWFRADRICRGRQPKGGPRPTPRSACERGGSDQPASWPSRPHLTSTCD